MTEHTDGFYEIEFQRMFKTQGHILRALHFRRGQLGCYLNKREELCAAGANLDKIESRIELTNARLARYNKIYEQIEAYKEEISIYNPNNVKRANDAKIVEDAYERAYAPVVVPTEHTGWLSKLAAKICCRQK